MAASVDKVRCFPCQMPHCTDYTAARVPDELGCKAEEKLTVDTAIEN